MVNFKIWNFEKIESETGIHVVDLSERDKMKLSSEKTVITEQETSLKEGLEAECSRLCYPGNDV